MIVVALPSAARADTVPIAVYRERLQLARDALLQARSQDRDARASAVASAQRLLRRTDAFTVGGRPIVAGAAVVADTLAPTDEAIAVGIGRIDALLATLPPANAPTVDAARADARLAEIVTGSDAQQSGSVLDVLTQLVLRFLAGLRGPRLDLGVLVTAVALLGIALVLFIVATLGRAIPERVRREVLVPRTATDERPDPVRQLRAADQALAAGRARDAIHALFLYVLAALAAREVLRDDPALTHQELLTRAAAIPHADALRDLVAIYERSWFGLREPSRDEAVRARDLALRVAP